MKNIVVYILLVAAAFSCNSSAPDVDEGELRVIEKFNSEFVTARNIYIWLPEDYNEKEQYDVLYMHDGQMLFDASTTWNKQEWNVDEHVQELINKEMIRQTIVVGIESLHEERIGNYCPEKAYRMLSDSIKNEWHKFSKEHTSAVNLIIDGDDYLKFIVYEVKPFIDQNFSTYSGVEHTFVAGSSRGGLISMYAFFEYPEIFGGAACLSTHWVGLYVENEEIPEAFYNYIFSRKALLGDRKIYFDYGTVTLDKLYPKHQKRVDNIFKGKSSKQYTSLEFEGEDHSENAWSRRLHMPLTFLLGTEE